MVRLPTRARRSQNGVDVDAHKVDLRKGSAPLAGVFLEEPLRISLRRRLLQAIATVRDPGAHPPRTDARR